MHTRIQYLTTLALLILFGLVFLFLLSGVKMEPGIYDEGFAVYGAARIMRGDVPYKDFWAIYTPGQFYALAAVFDLFGENLMAARIYDTLVRLAIAVAVYWLGKRLASPKVALIPCLIVAIWLGTYGYYLYAMFPALALGLFGILCLLEYISTHRQRWLTLAGIVVGLTTVFRLDVGIYASVAIGLPLVGLSACHVAPKADHLSKSFWVVARPVLVLATGAAAIVLPVFAYLAMAGRLDALWADLVVFPLTVLPQVRRLPYPALMLDMSPLLAGQSIYREYWRWLRFYLPPISYSVSAVGIVYSFIKRRRDVSHWLDGERTGLLAVTLFGALLFNQVLSRCDRVHILPTSILAALLLTLWVYRLPRRLWKRATFIVPVSAALIVIADPYLRPFIERHVAAVKIVPPVNCFARLERAGCIALNVDQEKAVEYIQAHTASSEYIFVGNRRHDAVFVNDILFYFLADRPSPTRYHELYPGVVTTLSVQQEIVGDLLSKNVRWIVTVNLPDSTEPNASAVSSGVKLLDDFIQAHYVAVETFGKYTIWRRE